MNDWIIATLLVVAPLTGVVVLALVAPEVLLGGVFVLLSAILVGRLIAVVHDGLEDR